MPASTEVEDDYLIVGAGAMGMAFADALVHNSDASVAIIDRRPAVGGHWLDAYQFVRLHQASAFYGVASQQLGSGERQTTGPEAGLHERATAPEICAYYGRVLDSLIETGRVRFLPGCEYAGEGEFRSRISGTRYRASRGRVVDATYLAPHIPAHTPPPFQVTGGADVVPVNDVPRVADAPSQYVIIGAGKTGIDTCVWLLESGVDPNRICWVRPRDPWLFNRAAVAPDPVTFWEMAADTMDAAVESSSVDDLFLRLEDKGVMLRIDRSVRPTMVKMPTIAHWEIDMLRTIENVIRRGHVRAAAPGRLSFSDGDVRIAPDALIVHCAASGLAYPPLVPIWMPDAIRLQQVRVGFPCFGAAVAGYVEATRTDDADKNDICRPTPYPNTPADWVRMQVIGGDASVAMNRASDVRAWANQTTLNPACVPADRADDPAVSAAADRLRATIGAGRARLAELSAQEA